MFRGRKKIPEHKRKYNYREDKRLYMGMLKMEIRVLLFATAKKLQRLSSLHKLMYEKHLQDTIAKYFEVKLKSSRSQSVKQIGPWFGVKWCEQEERNTRYFINLERRNHPNKYITRPKAENLTVTNPTENLSEEYHYCKNLYTSNFTVNPNDYDFVEFFESTTLSKLTRKVGRPCQTYLTQ